MKTLLIILVAYLSGSLAGCVPANEYFFTEYRVFKGTHYSIPSAGQPPLPENYVTFQFKTNNTWNFDYCGEPFMSKIGGIFWLYPHQCSVRICLETKKDGTEWLTYRIYDVNPARILMGDICALEIGKTYEVTLGLKNANYFIYIDDIEIEIPTDFVPTFEPRGFDSPYYGGNPTAPHTWIVPIKMVI